MVPKKYKSANSDRAFIKYQDKVQNKTIFNCWVKSTLVDKEANVGGIKIINCLLDALDGDHIEIQKISRNLGYNLENFEEIIAKEDI